MVRVFAGSSDTGDEPPRQPPKTPITNRKVWGGNRTPDGAHAQEVVSSVVQTCKNLTIDVFGFVGEALRGYTAKLFPTSATPNA